jgi:hypothetical protein
MRNDSHPSSSTSLMVFSVSGFGVAIALGWASAMLSVAAKAPLGLISLGLGVALGLALVALAELTRQGTRRGLMISAAALALLLVVAEHGWLYRAYRQKWWQNRLEQPAVALVRPEASPLSPKEYFERELRYAPGQWKYWALDASLISVAAVGVVLLRNRSTTSDAGRDNRSPTE